MRFFCCGFCLIFFFPPQWEGELDKSYILWSKEWSWLCKAKSWYPEEQILCGRFTRSFWVAKYIVFWLVVIGYRDYHLLLSASFLSLGDFLPPGKSLHRYMCSLADPEACAVLWQVSVIYWGKQKSLFVFLIYKTIICSGSGCSFLSTLTELSIQYIYLRNK